MELFESIGLKADPFTTSPNPDLFFPAKEHKQCLEGLELAIRMRRGLSVVRGGIGTGKTTISRKLIQNFASEEDMKFDFYPVLDPKFESELVLLQHLVDLFGIEDEIIKGANGILNGKVLRFKNEPVRHKTLDLIGDLALLGVPIKGHVTAARAGHASNVEFVKKLKKQYATELSNL